MSGAALTNDGLLGLILLMTALLMLFLFEIVRLPPQLARPTEQPVLNLPEPPPPAPPAPPVPPPALPSRRPRTHAAVNGASRAGLAGLTGNPAPAPRHAAGAPPVIIRPKVSGGPPWGPAPKPPGLDETPGRILPLTGGVAVDPAAQPASVLRKVAPPAPW